MSERDPHELLQELFDAVLAELPKRLKDEPTAAELSVARKLLRDNGQHLKAIDEADRRRFSTVRKLYVQRLQDALKGEPSAAVLREVLAFLTAADMVRGIGSIVDARAALASLDGLELPFQ